MNQIPDNSEIIRGYNKFLELRLKQAIANKKYRLSENGKIKTVEMHRAWILTKKDDNDYRQNIHKNQRERYRIRKNKKTEDAKKLDESTEMDISLGEINDSQNI
jgi:ribosomal protein L35